MEIEQKVTRQVEVLLTFNIELGTALTNKLEHDYENFLTSMPHIVGTCNTSICELYLRTGLKDTISACTDKLKIEIEDRDTLKLVEMVVALQSQIDSVSAQSTKDIDVCGDCGTKTNIDMEASEMDCPQCGKIIPLRGIIFKDEQINGSDGGHRVKANTYKTSKHFATWMNRILAIEQPAGGEVLVQEIRDHIKRYKITRDLVTYKFIRDYLLKNNRTDVNDNIAWILKEVTGRCPPELTIEERTDIEYRFNTIIDTFDKIRESTLSKPAGRTYYPFFIYKIIKCKFARVPSKLKLLNYIHEQKDKTIKKNEELYDHILEMANNPRLTAHD